MTAAELLDALRARGCLVWAEDGQVQVRSPPGVITPAVDAALRLARQHVLALLTEEEAAMWDAVLPAVSEELTAIAKMLPGQGPLLRLEALCPGLLLAMDAALEEWTKAFRERRREECLAAIALWVDLHLVAARELAKSAEEE